MEIIQRDTICAIVTPPGIGGISVIRLSGKDAVKIASTLFIKNTGKSLTKARPHTLHYGFIVDPSTGEKIDEVMVSLMKSPHSYTCEDVVEINCHGGPFVTGKILELLLRHGARVAEPGEFTKRAYLNGRIDLAQAEAVIDIIRAQTEEGLRCALWQLEGNLSQKIHQLHDEMIGVIAHLEAYIDFPEEDIEIPMDSIQKKVHKTMKIIDELIDGYYRWRPYREGVLTALVGRTNAGKSSLLNTLLGEERAIVSPYPGTTRDIVDGVISISDIPLRLLDTAGLREAKDMAEEEGIKRMFRAIDSAELILLVLDGSEALTHPDEELLSYTEGKRRIIIINKIDLGCILKGKISVKDSPVVYVSATGGDGIEILKKTIGNIFTERGHGRKDTVIVTNVRHKVALEEARGELNAFIEASERGLPLEILALHLRKGADHLREITGAITTEDILSRIFSEFCIGK